MMLLQNTFVSDPITSIYSNPIRTRRLKLANLIIPFFIIATHLMNDPSAPRIFLLLISAIYAGPAAAPAEQAPVIPLPKAEFEIFKAFCYQRFIYLDTEQQYWVPMTPNSSQWQK